MNQTLPPANYDEAAVGPVVLPPLTLDGRPVRDAAGREACRRAWLAAFARDLYGPIPPPPDRLDIARLPIQEEGAERIVLSLAAGGRRFQVDAALWLPARRSGPVPLIIGLDFIGPVGTMLSDAFPIDPDAIVSARPEIGLADGHLAEQARGVTMYRWPVRAILAAGWGVMTSCYGSWTPDHPVAWKRHGIFPLLGLNGASPTAAISLWAWALSRLIDAAERLPEIDAARVALAGHSRLGKAALWAAANDARASAAILSAPGCGGASPSRRNLGESLDQMVARFPHWLVYPGGRDPATMPVDQHQLIACVAPRRVYIAGASEDLWGDPRGAYLALRAAAPFWGIGGSVPDLPDADTAMRPGASVRTGPLGWHLRPGGHEMLPYDWRRYLPFLARA